MSNSNKWTESDIQKLGELWRNNVPTKDIAVALTRTVKSVEAKKTWLNQQPEKPWLREVLDAAAENTAKFENCLCPKENAAPKAPDKADYWKAQYQTVRKMLEAERWNKTEVEAMVEEVRNMAPLSYQTAPDVAWPKKSAGSPQSAVLLLSDCHVGQVIEPDQTLGLGSYNPEIFLSRLKRLEQTLFSILSDHVTSPVDELVVVILGDTLHGNLKHSSEADQRHTLFDQFYFAGHALAQFLRNVSALTPKVRIHTAVGNHCRWQDQKKMGTNNRYSNMDQVTYALIEALTKDIPKIEWHLNHQPFAVFDVQGWTFCGLHGDQLRGGDKAMGIPAHAIGRRISSMLGLRASLKQSPINYYVTGHLHRPISLPFTLGSFMVNGGWAGTDGYGLAEGFQASPPSQMFFLMHPKYGRTASYDLRLDFEPEGAAPHYNIPTHGS